MLELNSASCSEPGRVIAVDISPCPAQNALEKLSHSKGFAFAGLNYAAALEELKKPDVSLLLLGIDNNTPDLDKFADLLNVAGKDVLTVVVTSEKYIKATTQAMALGIDQYLFAETGDVAIGFFLDTLQGQCERRYSVARQNETSRRIMAAIPEVIIVFDEEGRYIQPIVTDANTDMFIQPPDELEGKTVHEFLAPEIANGLVETIKLTLDSQIPQTYSYPVLVKGKERWFEAQTAPLPDRKNQLVIWIARDVTRHKILELKLSSAEQLLQTVLDTLPIGVFWKDSHFRYLGMNKVCLNGMAATDIDQVIGKTDYDLEISTSRADRYREADSRVFHSGETEMGIIEKLDQDNSRATWQRSNKVPLKNARGRTFGVLGTFENITAEQELRLLAEETQANLVTAQAIAKVGSWELNPTSGESHWSEEVYRIHEMETDRTPLTLDEFERYYQNPAEARQLVAAVQALIAHGTTMTAEAWLTTASGASKRVRHLGIRHSKTHISGSIQDITESYERDHALLSSQALLHTIMNSIPFGLLWKDRDMKILGCNEFMRNFVGLKYAADIQGKKAEQLGIDADLVQKSEHEDRQILLAEEALIHGDAKVTIGDHRFMWTRYNKVPVYDSKGEISGVLTTIEDIGASKQAEQERYRTAELLASTQEIAKIGGWQWLRDENTLLWSDEVYRILEINRELEPEPSGEYFRSFLHPDRRGNFDSAFRRALHDGLPYNLDTRITTQHGQERWIRISGRPIYGDDKNIDGVIGTFQDITDEILREAEQKDFEARVQHSQKLESLGVLAGGIAHDFNNLLVSIMGYGSMAIDQVGEDAPLYGFLQNMIQAAQKAADLTKQMLAYSGKGKFVTEDLDVNELVGEMDNILRVTLPKGVILKEKLSQNIPQVLADKAQISQVVMNLITNAGEAIGEGSGTVSVTTGLVAADKNYLAGSQWNTQLEPGYYIALEVKDTGQGMDNETRERIFDPFFTTKFSGRGLGLAAVLGIVRGHGGAIHIESAPGKGSHFKVLLPVSETSGALFKEPCREYGELSGVALVVDDEEEIRELTTMILESNGMEVETANDGCDGVAQFKRDPQRYSLVILDMTMPRMGGQEAFRAMKSIRPDVRVVLSSGYMEQEATSGFEGNGPAGFIQKPYMMADFLAMVRHAMSENINPVLSEQE